MDTREIESPTLLEESAPIARSSKKLKHDVVEDTIPEEMEVQNTENLGEENTQMKTCSWSEKFFPEPQMERPPFYMGEDDEERYDSIDELFCI